MSIDFRENNKAKINSVYKPPEKIQKDRKIVYERYSEMKNGRKTSNGENLEEKWNGWMRMYEAWRPPRKADDWQSIIVPPFTTAIVERALAEIVDQTIQPKIGVRAPE